MTRYRTYAVLIAFMSLLSFRASASIMLGNFDWNPPDASDSSWTADHTGWVNINYPTTGGNTGGWMSITFPNTVSTPPNEWSEVIHTPATNLFVGPWTTQMWLQMDFWSSNYVADAVQFRWKSTTNSSVWRFDLTPQLGGTQMWQTVYASLFDWNNWKYVGATQSRYLSDLQSIDWIGVYIYRNTDNQQIYGIDNFQLWIPEPAELVMLAAAVLASGLSFRRRRRFSEAACIR